MFENVTPESIKAAILEEMSSDIDKREGSYTNDMVSPTAYELWRFYQSLNSLVPIVYIDETSGEYIDKKCAEYGIVRKPGTKAQAVLTVTGRSGTTIEMGKVFLTNDGLTFTSDVDVTLTADSVDITVTAADVGEKYNVKAGTITGQYINQPGITSVTNTQDATGGTDRETDISLVNRLYDYLQKPATSGNVYHYKQWALEVDGVGGAKVDPLWAGPGTVKVLIVGSDKGPTQEDVVERCAAHIEELRPIGATVTVESAEGLDITVAATVLLDNTTTKTAVQAEFTRKLIEYLNGIAFEKYEILYNRISFMLLDISGVIDYTSLTVNGGTENITIAANQVPILESAVIV